MPSSSIGSRCSAATRLDQRVDAALSGLGFSPGDVVRPPTSLSGGEQTRAALARLVIADPDLLLLDEPTNHLDLGALEWLEDHLRRRAGSLLVASHDRAFLDATVARVWELRDRRLTIFRGDYTAYHRQREERDARAAKDADAGASAIAREQELVQRYRSHRKFSKMHEHEARLERLQSEAVEAPRKRRKLRLPGGGLVGGGPARSGEIVIRADDVVVGYLPQRGAGGGPVRVARAPFLAARRGERIGIVGPNGAGKTTLLRTIAGELPPLDGSLSFGSGIQLGYLAQLRAAAIPGATVLDALIEAIPVTPGEARAYLARFLFRGDDVLKEVRLLSGGERSRLELALLGITPSNVLLLDEPTNHLDVVAREAIEAFLAGTPATILVISHDRRFLETICERMWVVEGGLVTAFDSGYRAWREAVRNGWTVAAAVELERLRLHPETRRTNGRRPATVRGSAPIPGGALESLDHPVSDAVAVSNRSRLVTGSRLPKLSKDAYRRERETIDADLTRLGLRKNHLELSMGDAAVQANFIELRRITSELADVDAALTDRRGRLARPRGARAMTIRIGITGPIGCGKSTIARWLHELGAIVVDADVIAREVVEPGAPAFDAVVTAFGPRVRTPDWPAGPSCARRGGVRGSSGAPQARGDRPPAGPAENRGRDRRCRGGRGARGRRRGDQAR